MSVPNQKVITINKAPFGDQSNNKRWLGVSYDAVMMAQSNLGLAGLRMWLYLTANKDNYQLELSCKACQDVGISRNTYYRGIEELEVKRYLIPRGEGETYYDFYDMPPVSF